MDLNKIENEIVAFTEEHEDLLQEYFAENHAEMVLDDDMPDAYDNWIVEVDPINLPGMVLHQTLVRFKAEVETLHRNLKKLVEVGEKATTSMRDHIIETGSYKK